MPTPPLATTPDIEEREKIVYWLRHGRWVQRDMYSRHESPEIARVIHQIADDIENKEYLKHVEPPERLETLPQHGYQLLDYVRVRGTIGKGKIVYLGKHGATVQMDHDGGEWGFFYSDIEKVA
jgi:hypothetical protein